MTPQEMKEKRLSLHLSQPALAARLGFSAAHVRNVEKGHTVLPDAVMELYNDVLVEGYKPAITADEIRRLRQERGLSRAPRHQEPLRQHERDRFVRDAGHGALRRAGHL